MCKSSTKLRKLRANTIKILEKGPIKILPITNGLMIFESSLDDCFIETFLPSAPVRAFAVFAGPIPPELTADTFMTCMV